MARHLTWCLKRTYVLTTRFDTHLWPRLVANMSNSVIETSVKSVLAAPKINKLDFDVSEIETRDLANFVEDAKQGKKHAIPVLMKLLCISEANAAEAVNKYPSFKNLTKQQIYENFQLLREGGVFKSTIKDNKFLLLGTPEEVKTKMDLIKSMDIEINDGAALFQLTVALLKRTASYSKIDNSYLPNRNKLYYMAEKLKCDIKTVCHAMSYSPFVLLLPPPTLLTITEYVLAAGMAPQHILSDLGLYRYTLAAIKERVERAKALGINPLKPWIMRCADRCWEVAQERFDHRNSLFKPDQTKEELICEVFGCDTEMAQCILNRHWKFGTIAIEKLHNNLRLFKAQGYTAEDIMMAPLAVQRKTRTLEQLFEKWNEAGLPKPRLTLFCMSPKYVQQVMDTRRAELKKPQIDRDVDEQQ